MYDNNPRTDFENFPAELLPLMAGFLSRRKGDIQELRLCLRESRFNDCKNLAHRLKGGGTSYGFPVMSELGEQMEKAAKAENRYELAELIQIFEHVVMKAIHDFKLWENKSTG